MLPLNPDLDLQLTRLLPAPPEKVWRCFAEVELLKQWFAPKPVLMTDAVLDLAPGGRFYIKMRLPDGNEFPSEGCVLQVEKHRRLVFTESLVAGFRPAHEPMLSFTAIITMEPEGAGTRYTATALHPDPGSREKHAEMGFQEGWGTCADQLGVLAAGL